MYEKHTTSRSLPSAATFSSSLFLTTDRREQVSRVRGIVLYIPAARVLVAAIPVCLLFRSAGATLIMVLCDGGWHVNQCSNGAINPKTSICM